MTINLLPQELKPKGSSLALAKTLKKIALILLLLFLVSSMTIISAFLLYDRKLNQSVKYQENLTKEITALQKTEHKIVLLADRIDKFSKISNLGSANKGVSILEKVSNHFSEGITFKDATLNADSTKIAVYSDNLENLSRFILELVSSNEFSSIYLTKLTFSKDEGYSAEFGFVL